LAVLGGCLGAYAVLAFVFHWLIEPSVGKTSAVYAPPPMAVVPPQPDAAASVPPVTPRRAAMNPLAVAPRNATADTPAASPKDTPKKQITRTRPDHAVRVHRDPSNFMFGSFGGSRRWF
jgi:hypothetical protein